MLPGFVDVHTHYDAQVLWDAELSPSLWQGVTSVVAGNCGFSLAPAREGGRGALLRTLETVEDMRMATMQAGIVWDFETYPEYLDAVERRRPAINFGGYVGHTALRVYVMGDDASERCATETELAAMRALVADALRGGALGFLHGSRRVRRRRRRTPGAVHDRVAGRSGIADPRHRRSRTRHRAHRAGGRLRVVVRLPAHARTTRQLVVDPGLSRGFDDARASYRAKLAAHAQGRAQGADVWAQVTCRPIRQLVTLRDPAPFSTVPAFAEVLAIAPEHRREPYADGSWRARAGDELAASTIPVLWDKYVVAESERHPELLGRSVRSLAEARGREPFDVLCDIALDDDLETRFSITFANDDPTGSRSCSRVRGASWGSPMRELMSARSATRCCPRTSSPAGSVMSE